MGFAQIAFLTTVLPKGDPTDFVQEEPLGILDHDLGPSQPGNLEMISMTFASVICDADEPCSVNAA